MRVEYHYPQKTQLLHERFSEDIYSLIGVGNKNELHSSPNNMSMNEVEVNLNMLGEFIKYTIHYHYINEGWSTPRSAINQHNREN